MTLHNPYSIALELMAVALRCVVGIISSIANIIPNANELRLVPLE